VERVFSVSEARTLLPALTDLLTKLIAAQREIVDTAPPGGHRVAAGNGSAAAAAGVSAAEHLYVELLREIDSMGVIVRDASTGLIDFAATRGSEPVYLCWRLHEPDIGYWHPRTTGFAGRLPL